MKFRVNTALPVCLVIAGLAQAAAAETPEIALNDAVRRGVCGTAQPVSAEYLPTGELKVTCRQIASEGPLAGTGLTNEQAGVALFTVLALAVIAGDSDDSATTTTTTSTR